LIGDTDESRGVLDRRDVLWMSGLFGLGLLLRVVHLITIRELPFFTYLILDPRMYDEWATRIVAGAWLGDRPFFQDPLYAYLLAVIYRVAGHDYVWVVAFQGVLGATVAPLLYRAAQPWFGRAVAATAGGIAALYLPSIYYEGMILKTGLGVFLVAAVLTLLSRACIRGGRLRWFVTGLTLGLACLARGNLILTVPLLALWVLFDPNAGSRVPLRRFGSSVSRVAAAMLLLGAVSVLGPTSLRNRVVGEEWILTTSNAGQNFYIGNNPDNLSGRYEKVPFVDANPKHEERGFAREAEARTGRKMTPSEVSRFWFAESWRWIRANPLDGLSLAWRKLRVYWGAFEVPDNLDYYLYRESAPVLRLPLPGFGWVAPLGLLGAGLLLRTRGWPRALILFVALYSASVIAFFVFSRFRMPMMPAIFVLAGYAAVELVRRARSAVADRSVRVAMTIPVAVLIALMAFVNLPVRAHRDSLSWRIAESTRLPRRLETSSQGRFNLGVAYAAQAKDAANPRRLLELAEGELRLALETDDRFAISFIELAKVLARLDRNAEALELYF